MSNSVHMLLPTSVPISRSGEVEDSEDDLDSEEDSWEGEEAEYRSDSLRPEN